MNLGDGLLFELENGKPKLILLNRGEKVQKSLAKPRPRLPSVLSCRQPSRLDTPRVEEQLHRKQIALKGKSHQNKPARVGATVRGQSQISSKTQENLAPLKEAKSNAKVKPAKPQNVRPIRKTVEPTKKVESNNPSCVTNEQLQQILSVVQTSNDHPRTEERKEDRNLESEASEPKEIETIRTETKAGHTLDTEKQCGGLFSWVEQRPSEDRAVLEAKKTQWKKELGKTYYAI